MKAISIMKPSVAVPEQVPEHNGTSAVQSHMTNSRLTDPEILEQRFPVLLKLFSPAT